MPDKIVLPEPAKALLPEIEITPLDIDRARQIATAEIARISKEFKEVGANLADLLGGTPFDVLNESGLAANGNAGRTIGQEPNPDQSGSGFETPEGLRMPDTPSNRRRGVDLSAPDPATAMRGSASKGGQYPGSNRGTGSVDRYDADTGRTTTSVMYSDGTRATGFIETTPEGDSRLEMTTERPNGDIKTTVIIVTSDGRMATVTDSRPHDGPARSHAEGDPEAVYAERDRRYQEDATRTQDPDSGTGGSNYNPLTGQYWGPRKRTDVNQVNPGRGDSVAPVNGPDLNIDSDSLVVNPNPEALPGKAQPRDPRENNPNQVDPPRI